MPWYLCGVMLLPEGLVPNNRVTKSYDIQGLNSQNVTEKLFKLYLKEFVHFKLTSKLINYVYNYICYYNKVYSLHVWKWHLKLSCCFKCSLWNGCNNLIPTVITLKEQVKVLGLWNSVLLMWRTWWCLSLGLLWKSALVWWRLLCTGYCFWPFLI